MKEIGGSLGADRPSGKATYPVTTWQSSKALMLKSELEAYTYPNCTHHIHTEINELCLFL